VYVNNGELEVVDGVSNGLAAWLEDASCLECFGM